ncbi:MAG: heme lyase CcmF/NrfE family subunit [Pseudomonadales bacterium]|jgi:cytochrome c-type biogenesis protein CcmF|nr:heme lyase CcmF/NrfE family subunit [Pseudomonadales bacterium]MCP5332651.1 heme lyase CcmF/NrfE family subunit [Pseudomonadales bacterium]HMU91230.1 heme lyase CcmF/NrfE family subunit [Pseudomonadales bacterium]HMW15734.1 heme lyase CcmF/NrfE family subunit [Pseudomonadales bacterium]HMW84058.1 heme lyase CcmF/NrfE family subunit [Pseudomonadales bacterium]
MIVELGHFALILAFMLALALVVIPLGGVLSGRRAWMALARPLASGQFVLLLLSAAALEHALLTDDFSVAYVASNSNSQLPAIYKFSAFWGAHEGSLLLWLLLLAGWSFAVARFSRRLPLDMVARVLAVMGAVATGFHLFLLTTSNPFARLLPIPPAEGRDLNPLLQDPGLVIHPPMLYMGYVGFSVAFAFAIAALTSGRLDAAWARWSRPWTAVAWLFLTLGITLGSWWAYYELGWGGWWFWDPVENASFMPWLIGTALIHSLAATEKRGVFKSWTVLLAIFAFSLSLLGTFLVRSGVLTSVHAFAVDPQRGMFILLFLLLVIGGSLTLYAMRAPTVASQTRFELWSRESFLLFNNLLLTVACASVLIGTLYPLAYEALNAGRKISVGPPYFNAVFIPLMGLLILFMGAGPLLRWRATDRSELLRRLLWMALIALPLALLLPWLLVRALIPSTAIAALLAGWIGAGLLLDLIIKGRQLHAQGGLRRLPISHWGMVAAHLGVAVTALGIALVSHHSSERDLRLKPGESAELAGHRFQFKGVSELAGPNYLASHGEVEVSRAGHPIATLAPQKRLYQARGNSMTEAAIDPGFTRDLYIALGEPLENGAWALRIQYKAYVRWIWLGGLLMVAGALLTLCDRRYRTTGATP